MSCMGKKTNMQHSPDTKNGDVAWNHSLQTAEGAWNSYKLKIFQITQEMDVDTSLQNTADEKTFNSGNYLERGNVWMINT